MVKVSGIWIVTGRGKASFKGVSFPKKGRGDASVWKATVPIVGGADPFSTPCRNTIHVSTIS